MDNHLPVKLTASLVALTLVASAGKLDADQPHVHVENVPFDQSVDTLSYETRSNIVAPTFGFDQEPGIAGFDVGVWT